ncbi:MAG: alpha/beta hydrolase family protein [Planctomycetota bacterium]
MEITTTVRTLFAATLLGLTAIAQNQPFEEAERNAARSQQAIQFCRRYSQGWLAHADPASGLLPRTTSGDRYWNAKDCAADNFPFLLLTAHVTGDHHLARAAEQIFDQERRLTLRLDALPDDFFFDIQGLKDGPYDLEALIFGASEYAKDGLMPVVELLGEGPWLARMEELIQDIWKHAAYETPVGLLPSLDVEVGGELLQTMSRLYWLSAKPEYKEWALRLADYYFFHANLLSGKVVRLRDHGCEILGGLSEAYVIAAREDPERHEQYRRALSAILDRILEIGLNEHGMMVNAVDPRSGEVTAGGLSDGWGYVYNAYLTVAELDDLPRYRAAVQKALENIHQYAAYSWEGDHGADGYADSIEGAINLLNRIPVDSAREWVHAEIQHIFEKQRPDGIIEGWYGDGNSARTALMYALMCTEGCAATPWRDDLALGAERGPEGAVRISLRSEWPWRGRLRCDRPRHREVLHMENDYPRINQFPEWFTVESDRGYVLEREGKEPRPFRGAELSSLELRVPANQTVHLIIRPLREGEKIAWRDRRYTPGSAGDAARWQQELRADLGKLLRLEGKSARELPLDIEQVSSSEGPGYELREIELQATPGRRIRALVTSPRAVEFPVPAVVCIHGHGGNRGVVHSDERSYRRFAAKLAEKGLVTIAVDVGQHEVYEEGRTLLGERLGDLMRCVDYLTSLEQVDESRIGCAGLSLGGEMVMWLAAMDTRIAAAVSSGFLTTMDQMEQNHCMCWKFDGLRELVDYADIYSLVAPRFLECQNGILEGPNDFFVPIAREVLSEIKTIYRDFGQQENTELLVHKGGHQIDLPSLLEFFERHLGRAK